MKKNMDMMKVFQQQSICNGSGWTADPADNCVYRIFSGRCRSFCSGPVYGRMDPRTSLGCMLHVVVAFFFAENGYVIKRDKLTAKIVGKTIWDAIPSLFLVVIIIGGILSGKFTPTEASGVAVAYAFILSVFVQND